MNFYVSNYMCRTFCCGLKMLRFLLIFEFVYFYTINPVTEHLRNCILTLMTHSRPWNQLLHSCALLSNILNQTFLTNWKLRRKWVKNSHFGLFFARWTLSAFVISTTLAHTVSTVRFHLRQILYSSVLKQRVLSSVHLSRKCLLIFCLEKLPCVGTGEM